MDATAVMTALVHRERTGAGQYIDMLQNESSMHFSTTPGGVCEPAPLLGEHNNYVLGELLGIASEEIARLKEAGVVA
jgi:crotonobetainyl-CoA:carnitine CoA-transferase CaiB-like acyl-CoA transferase